MRVVLLVFVVAGCSSGAGPARTPHPAPAPDAAPPDADPTRARIEAVLASDGDRLRAVPGVLTVDTDGQALDIVACTQEIVAGLGLDALAVPTAVVIEPAGIPDHECGCTFRDTYYPPGWVEFPCNAHHCEAGQWTATTLVSCELQILETISFAKGKTELDAGTAQLDAIAKAITGNALVVAVHGHRQKKEQASVSKARAAIVVDWLVGAGVPADQLRAVDDGVGADRVVTFEVVSQPDDQEP